MILERRTAAQSRSRPLYAVLVAAVLVLGLASRRFATLLPGLLHKNTGDVLWALLVFLVLGLLFPRRSTWTIAGLAAVFSLSIEISKLYHTPGFDTLRATTLGRLVFGYAFSWSNLACYLLGIGLGIALERWRTSPHAGAVIESP